MGIFWKFRHKRAGWCNCRGGAGNRIAAGRTMLVKKSIAEVGLIWGLKLIFSVIRNSMRIL